MRMALKMGAQKERLYPSFPFNHQPILRNTIGVLAHLYKYMPAPEEKGYGINLEKVANSPATDLPWAQGVMAAHPPAMAIGSS